MPTTITGSPNITSLDSKIVADLCSGFFHIDVTPSTFLPGGTATSGAVQGADVRVTNPLGVVIKQYHTSGFDIYPPMTSIVDVAIPKTAGVFIWGTYTIDVRLTDEDATETTITKYVNICPPDANNKNKNTGCMNVSINGNCRTGNVVFLLQNPPNYKGKTFSTQVNDLTVKYPTESGKDDLETSQGSFSLLLYEGQYQVSGTVCATYSYGDNVFYEVKYTVKCEKIIKCIIDECCVFAKFEELNLKLTSDCTPAERDNTASTIIDAMRLLKTAELAAQCGKDPSDYISQLESLLGCVCTCNCNEGVPIIGTDGAGISFTYKALLSQSGTAIPTAEISGFNSAIVTWTRTGVGNYVGTLSGSFTPLTVDNTFIVVIANADFKVKANYLSANSFDLHTTTTLDVASDNKLSNTPFELSIL